MPRDKDLKRRVRARMHKTGESYTTARAHVLAAKPARRSDAAISARPAADYAAIAGTRDETLLARTGRTWQQWVHELDALDAAAKSHTAIARLVHERFEIPGWWAQTVTVGYERIRGLREKGQKRDGGYEVGKSKTVPVPVAKLYAAFAPGPRRRWLGDVALQVKKATKPRSIRIRWSDGTPVEVTFWQKGARKSMVNVQHRKLATRADAERLRAFWGERLAALADSLA